MADKECSSYEVSNGSHNQQKATATSIQLPSLTSKPLKQQQQIMKEKDDQGDSSSPPSGYYFNVAQKGKLILPTALWVLLIIAGISFLTLLASLNHTVDTLDTLVELEQEKEAQQRYEHYERLHHLQHGSDEHHGQQHNKKHQHQNEEASFGRSRQPSRKPEQESSSRRHHELESSATESESSAMMLGPFSSSWFSFPSWASLEPLAAREHTIVSKVKPEASASHRHIVSSGNQLMPPQVESMMNDMMRQMMGPADRVGGSVPEISGSFIISSSSDGSNMQMSSGSGATRDQPSDMMDSIFKQVMPMLDSLTMMGPSELTKDAPKSSQKQREAQPVEPQVQGPMISANIENLNINLNGNNGEQDSKKADDDDDKDNNSNKPAASEQAEIEDLAKTIDSVVSKLMGQPTTSAPSNHDLDPMVEVVRIGSEPTHHHHHNRRKNHRLEQVESQSLPASLSSLLMPLGIGNQLMPIQSLEIGSDSSPFGPSSILVADERPSHRHSHGRPEVAKASSSLEEVMKHAHQLPEGPQMIISIASDEPQADQKQQSLQLPELASLITGQPIGHHSAGSSDSHRAPQRTSGGQSPYELPVGSPISSLLDSFRDFDQTVAATANKQHEHHHSTKKPIDELQKLKEDAKWDVLSNDLADSFLQGLLQSPQPFGSGELGLQSIGQQQQPQSIILVNGKPLDQSERQKSPEASKDRDSKSPTTPSEDTSELGAKSISDVLNLLFGPTSSLAPSTASSASTSSSTTKSTSTTKESQKASDEESSVEKFFKEMKNQLEESVSSPATIIKTDGPQSGSPSELFSLIQPSPALASKSDETSTKAAKDSNDSFMNDFIGTMFTLPQFGESSSQQREVGSNSGGSSSGGSSSGGSSSGGSSSGGSSPSVLLESTTPVSTVSQVTTTKKNSAPIGKQTPKPSSVSPTVSNEANSKADNLPKDPFLKGFLGIGQGEPFFAKEEVNVPLAKTVPATTTTQVTTTTKQANTPSSSGTSTASAGLAGSSTRSTEKLNTPAATTTTASHNQEQTTLKQSTRPTAVVIRADEAPLNFPMIDLAPFAKREGQLETDSKRKHQVATTKVDGPSSTPASLPTTLSSPVTTTGRPTTVSVAAKSVSTSVAPTTTTISNNSHNKQTTTSGAQSANKTSTISTTSATAGTTGPSQNSNHTTGKPLRSFLEKADDFIERNLLNFKRLF